MFSTVLHVCECAFVRAGGGWMRLINFQSTHVSLVKDCSCMLGFTHLKFRVCVCAAEIGGHGLS